MTIYRNQDPDIYAAFELTDPGAVIVPVAAWRIGCDGLVPMVVTDRGLSALSIRFRSDYEHASEYYGGNKHSFKGVFGLDQQADKDFLLYLAGDRSWTETLEAVRSHMADPLITVAEAEEVERRNAEARWKEIREPALQTAGFAK